MALIAAGLVGSDVLGFPNKVKEAWDVLSAGKGRHNFKMGQVQDSDEVLYYEEIRKSYAMFGSVTHTFSYACKKGEEITAVVAYDCWDDDTGGEAVLKNGGLGKGSVEIEVTSQLMRGFEFKFYVYGKK